jgi:flavodoxin I
MFRFDEREPEFLIIYTGDEHGVPDDYRRTVERWLARMEKGGRFGVIMVDEPHEHHEDEEDHRQYEAEITRLINDFRRDYRHLTSQFTVGYARVVPTEWMDLYFKEPGAWEQALEHNNMYAQYNWGIPGGGFTDLAEAKAWIRDLLTREPAQPVEPTPVKAASSNKRVGLYYGSSTGITEYIAQEIEEAWKAAGMEPVEPVNIGDVKDAAALLDYDYLILGIPTWNIGQLQDDWDILFPQLDHLDFSGKTAAIFGVGDQRGYPDNFLDAVGILGNKLLERGARLVGYWYDEHYAFTESLAFVDGRFMGLGIDDDNQAKLNSERIEQWVAQIIGEFALQPSAAVG